MRADPEPATSSDDIFFKKDFGGVMCYSGGRRWWLWWWLTSLERGDRSGYCGSSVRRVL
ncbi:hypothetical protein Hdeb2414_s0019g00543731 [Helianthus debilis subsp. tardiflorus]